MPDIHLLMTADAAGGVWTYGLEMAQALSARGFSTTLAILGDPPSDAALPQALARQAQRVYALPRLPIVIHNGRSPPDEARTRTRDIRVLTAGRLWDEGKNIATLDRAAARLPFKVCAAGPVLGPNGAAV